MEKEEFLGQLRHALIGLPDDERDRVIQYYEEYFEDAKGQGNLPEDLDSPEQIARDILSSYADLVPLEEKPSDIPPPQAEQATHTFSDTDFPSSPNKSGLSPGVLLFFLLVLLILLPVFLGVLATLFGVLLTLIAVIASLAVGGIALALTGVGLMIYGVLNMQPVPAFGIMVSGVGLMLLALGILWVLGIYKLFVWAVPPCIRGLVSLVHKLLERVKRIL